MTFREVREGVEHERPDDDKEADNEEPDGPCWGVLGREEVAPITTVWGGEKVILYYHCDEKPEDNFATS